VPNKLKHKPKILIASLSVFGRTIACSYRPDEKTSKKEIIEAKKAKAPNSSGEKIRVKIGVNATGKICAIVVPVISVTTFFPKSDFTYLFNMIWNQN
jgi:hypothetical protein